MPARIAILRLALSGFLANGASMALAGPHDQPSPPRLERLPIAPPVVNAAPGTVPTPGEQIQLQLYRDLLQTRQRALEDRIGTENPLVGIEALRNQQKINRLNTVGPRQ
jgi:hypothetical protein